MRRAPRLLLIACLAALGPLAACSDDDGDEGSAATTSDQISTEGVCDLVDVERASEIMGVRFDRAVSGDGSCTYTSSSSQTAFTVQRTGSGANDPALVLETMASSCDPDTREERTFRGADGGFSCLAGGVPNVVAAGGGTVLVLTGNSRDGGVTPEAVVDDLAAILADADVSFGES
jgi:hypothetical protein